MRISRGKVFVWAKSNVFYSKTAADSSRIARGYRPDNDETDLRIPTKTMCENGLLANSTQVLPDFTCRQHDAGLLVQKQDEEEWEHFQNLFFSAVSRTSAARAKERNARAKAKGKGKGQVQEQREGGSSKEDQPQAPNHLRYCSLYSHLCSSSSSSGSLEHTPAMLKKHLLSFFLI